MGTPIEDPTFGFEIQVTARSSPSFFGGIWAEESFWDGRAGSSVYDPITDELAIASGGALENQSLEPILSEVEMAQEGRTWSHVTEKLAGVQPLALASDLPGDIQSVLSPGTGYEELFESAFGSPGITPLRISFAIATYERTLVADQTPWDLYIAGDASAMTPNQTAGWNAFRNLPCAECHAPPLFTDNSFANIGLRDPGDDLGRQAITGLPGDKGRFKIPSLRNVGQRVNLMHTGAHSQVALIIDSYHPFEFHFNENLDPRVPVIVNGASISGLLDFLLNGLTDPRVASGAYPFDRPTLARLDPHLVPEPGAKLQFAIGCLVLALITRSSRFKGQRSRGRLA